MFLKTFWHSSNPFEPTFTDCFKENISGPKGIFIEYLLLLFNFLVDIIRVYIQKDLKSFRHIVIIAPKLLYDATVKRNFTRYSLKICAISTNWGCINYPWHLGLNHGVV